MRHNMKQQDNKAIPIERLRELLTYDADTGDFRWAVSRGRARAGDLAGSITTRGHVVVRIDEVLYQAHRLAYALFHGVDPADLTIDHINGNPLDNSIANLRTATQTVQMRNRGQMSNNTSGVTGVRLDEGHGDGSWTARWTDGDTYRCKSFSIRKHGYEEAKALAIAARAEALAALDHYTTRHGVAA
jgi:hypothetical protein